MTTSGATYAPRRIAVPPGTTRTPGGQAGGGNSRSRSQYAQPQQGGHVRAGDGRLREFERHVWAGGFNDLSQRRAAQVDPGGDLVAALAGHGLDGASHLSQAHQGDAHG